MFNFEQLQELSLYISSCVDDTNPKLGDWYLYSSPCEYKGKAYFEMIFEVYSSAEEDFTMKRQNIGIKEGSKIIRRALREFLKWKTSLPPGVLLSASAYKEDNLGEKRKILYESLGFIDEYLIT